MGGDAREREGKGGFTIKSNSIDVWEFIEKISVCELEKSGGLIEISLTSCLKIHELHK